MVMREVGEDEIMMIGSMFSEQRSEVNNSVNDDAHWLSGHASWDLQTGERQYGFEQTTPTDLRSTRGRRYTSLLSLFDPLQSVRKHRS